jgi:hypothetical protein
VNVAARLVTLPAETTSRRIVIDLLESHAPALAIDG